MAQPDLRHIPLDELRISKLNMRHSRKKPDVSDILPSIRESGLRQTLLVRREGKYYGVIAGRRRFFALKEIAKETGETPLVQRAVREFLTTPIDWYMHLALHSSLHLRVSLSEIEVPTSFVAGTYDVLASAADMRTAAARTDGDYLELAASHFLPLEHPGTVHAALLELVRQSRRQAA